MSNLATGIHLLNKKLTVLVLNLKPKVGQDKAEEQESEHPMIYKKKKISQLRK